ncbi:MAG: hypothetical protein KC492_44445, partial [Myxococcales bacterium]|nr:hypothetical protein [Myxococcales bacterium]
MTAIEIERRIVAPSLEVWRAISTAKGLALWQADEVKGDVTEGSVIELGWPALGVSMELDVAEVEQGRRVVLQDMDTKLVIEVIAGGLRLTHESVHADDLEGMSSSWRLALSQLGHSLERHPGLERKSHWAAQPLHASAETVYAFGTEPALASRWLWSGTVGQEGERAELRIAQRPLSGRVLCHVPGRDLSIVWEEEAASTLSLRTLPSPFSADERIVALVWSVWQPAELE